MFKKKGFKKNLFFMGCCVIGIMSCQNESKPCRNKGGKLPIIGNKAITNQGDTIYPTIRSFSFTNQQGEVVNNNTFQNKIYVIDFFFTSCPTICPKVTAQMLRVYERFKENPNILLLSHTIDPKRDTPDYLRNYAQKLGIMDAQKWHFVTGEKDSLYAIANDYFSIAKEDPNAPGGFDHSGRLILVDKARHVRTFCDGTNPQEVDCFMGDIETLLKER
jgi:protein SCO1/2